MTGKIPRGLNVCLSTFHMVFESGSGCPAIPAIASTRSNNRGRRRRAGHPISCEKRRCARRSSRFGTSVCNLCCLVGGRRAACSCFLCGRSRERPTRRHIARTSIKPFRFDAGVATASFPQTAQFAAQRQPGIRSKGGQAAAPLPNWQRSACGSTTGFCDILRHRKTCRDGVGWKHK
jgi:hypothetical protein